MVMREAIAQKRREGPVGVSAAMQVGWGRWGEGGAAPTVPPDMCALAGLQEDFEEAVRQEFAKLMSGGDMTANQAAAAALRAAAAAKGKPKA